MSDREVVLARVRTAASGHPARKTPLSRRRRATAKATPEELGSRFVERLRDYGTRVRLSTIDGLHTDLADELATANTRQLVVPADAPSTWAQLGPLVLCDDPPLTVRRIAASDASLTCCAVAIANTGTIVLDGGAVQGRRVLSLLPDSLNIVVRAAQVVATIGEALAALAPTAPQTWISGPSATSDIELQRVVGVHGPRRLTVILVQDDHQES